MTTNPDLLTAAEAADVLHVRTSWVYDHARDLPTIYLDRLLRFDRDELIMWMREQRTPRR